MAHPLIGFGAEYDEGSDAGTNAIKIQHVAHESYLVVANSEEVMTKAPQAFFGEIASSIQIASARFICELKSRIVILLCAGESAADGP